MQQAAWAAFVYAVSLVKQPRCTKCDMRITTELAKLYCYYNTSKDCPRLPVEQAKTDG